jgi:hypothetical protein
LGLERALICEPQAQLKKPMGACVKKISTQKTHAKIRIGEKTHTKSIHHAEQNDGLGLTNNNLMEPCSTCIFDTSENFTKSCYAILNANTERP